MDDGCDGTGVGIKNEAVPRQELGRDMGSGAMFPALASKRRKVKGKRRKKENPNQEKEKEKEKDEGEVKSTMKYDRY